MTGALGENVVVRALWPQREAPGTFRHTKGKFKLESPWDVHVLLRDADDGVYPVHSDSSGWVSVGKNELILVARRNFPFEISYDAVKRDENGFRYDLRLAGRFLVEAPAAFVRHLGRCRLAAPASLQADDVLGLVRIRLEPHVRKFVAEYAWTDLQDRLRLPATRWESRFNEWLSEFGLCWSITQTPLWSSGTAEIETRRADEVRAEVQRREQELEAEKARQAEERSRREEEAEKRRRENERRHTEAEREHEMELQRLRREREREEEKVRLKQARRRRREEELREQRVLRSFRSVAPASPQREPDDRLAVAADRLLEVEDELPAASDPPVPAPTARPTAPVAPAPVPVRPRPDQAPSTFQHASASPEGSPSSSEPPPVRPQPSVSMRLSRRIDIGSLGGAPQALCATAGVLIALHRNGDLVAFRPPAQNSSASGEERWRVGGPERAAPFWQGSLHACDDRLLLVGDRHAALLDVATGQTVEVWPQLAGQPCGRASREADVWLLLEQDLLMHCDLRTGATQQLKLPEARPFTCIAAGDGEALLYNESRPNVGLGRITRPDLALSLFDVPGQIRAVCAARDGSSRLLVLKRAQGPAEAKASLLALRDELAECSSDDEAIGRDSVTAVTATRTEFLVLTLGGRIFRKPIHPAGPLGHVYDLPDGACCRPARCGDVWCLTCRLEQEKGRCRMIGLQADAGLSGNPVRWEVPMPPVEIPAVAIGECLYVADCRGQVHRIRAS